MFEIRWCTLRTCQLSCLVGLKLFVERQLLLEKWIHVDLGMGLSNLEISLGNSWLDNCLPMSW